MLELAETRASVVLCLATPPGVDAAVRAVDAWPVRVAPDEAMVIGPRDRAGDLVEAIDAAATEVDPDAVVLDATDGWWVWTLSGPSAPEALVRLCPLPIPGEGWLQCPVAHVPAKVVTGERGVHLLVAAMWSEHVGRVIREVCEDLDLREADGAIPWAETPDRSAGR